ncbi:hypothetical protein [Sphingomonas panacis]|uniref:hypothetical protein n=1 Tax=Sphingomonas panacis TaxID=1560345 RepID=UPI0014712C4C|nr:hypothetical protein [Sphingomonas panacis]
MDNAFGTNGIDPAVEDVLRNMDWDMARQVELDLTIDISDGIHRIRAPTLVIGFSHD